MCWKCGSGCSKKTGLCPFSFGLAFGITCALTVFFWSIWVMSYGMPTMWANLQVPMPTLESASIHSLLTLLKGFIFGMVLAALYDLFICCGMKMCHKKNGTCDKGCCTNDKCCCGSKPDVVVKERDRL